ncbi:MAG: acyl-CoA thioesterase [Chloroflexi bacterium]|nr:acyl-CoA thioesterase [Chloroflexota bacterium]
MGVAYYGTYLVWFEIGRTEYMREAGLPYAELERAGLHLPVVECVAHYKAPAHYDEELIISTTVGELNRFRIAFHYEILASNDRRLIATGLTQHVFMNQDGRPRHLAVDSSWWQRLQQAVGDVAEVAGLPQAQSSRGS